MRKHDPALDALLDLNGITLVVDPEGGHWVKIRGHASSSRRRRSRMDWTTRLRCMDQDGERLVGFDNAHPEGKQKRGDPQDHRHRFRTVKLYEYSDAATLLADFWTEVDAVLKERGVLS